MISSMPVGSNSGELVYALNKLVVNYCSESCRAYYKRLVWHELIVANKNGWLVSAKAQQVINFVVSFVCLRNSICAGKVSVDYLIDWIAGNRYVSFTQDHINYIEANNKRIKAVDRYSVCYILDTMNRNSEFDPPYTHCHDLNYDLIFY